MKAKRIESLSLIVPVLNEEEVIKETIGIYTKELQKLCKKYEIIVVDDGSEDKTAFILQKLKKEKKHIVILTHKKNLGVGKSILDGFKIAKYKWVFHNSADQPFDLSDLNKVTNKMETSDVVVFTRKDRSANPFFRKITSLVSYTLVKIFFNVPINDFHFVQLYRKNVLKNIHIHSEDTFAPAELLIKLYRKGFKFKQQKAVFHRRTAGSSKYNNPIRYLRYLRDLISLRQQLL
ncbi:MAG: glycosyltransferase family 2 protein [Candidatus Woesebacteria bacterium]|nr:MAG: glycosyltransferase family 2 protein [Candidatus Woesebacteria bacterium]